MKILAIDIETRPNVVYTWGLYNQNIGLNQIIETGGIICFAAKWLGDDRGSHPGDQKAKRDGTVFYSDWQHGHEGMLAAAHDLLDQADALVHWNGARFDTPWLNKELLEHGFGMYSPVREIDLMRAVKRRFRFASNKLDHVLQELGFAGKESTGGFDLWTGVLRGDNLAEKRMEKYNRRDVTGLEDLYDLLLPWLPNHPVRPLIDGITGLACPRCSGTHLQRRGYAHTNVSTFRQYQCNACGHYFRGSQRVKATEARALAA